MCFNPNLPRIEVDAVIAVQIQAACGKDLEGQAVFKRNKNTVAVEVTTETGLSSSFTVQTSDTAGESLHLGGYETQVPSGSKAVFSFVSNKGKVEASLQEVRSTRGRASNVSKSGQLPLTPAKPMAKTRQGSTTYVTMRPGM